MGRFEQHMEDVDQHAEELLVHGMSREELTELVSSIFERMDSDGSGTLSKNEFASALTSMELGLTRREINTIMFQIDQDNDGNISYREFVPFAFDLLHKFTSLRLLETEMEHDELAQFLSDLFKSKDTEMTGHLHGDDMRDLLHQAMLGLSRMQIYTVISEADTNADMMIAYGNFIPRAVGLIRSMLSFEKSILHDSKETDAEAEENFYMVMDEALGGAETLTPEKFCSAMEATGILDAKELQAVRNLVVGYGEAVPVEDAKAQVWPLVKNVRRHKGIGK